MNVWLLTNTPSPYQLELLSAIHADGRSGIAVRLMLGKHRGMSWQPSEKAFPCQVMSGIGPGEYRLHASAFKDAVFAPFDLFVLSGHYTSPTFLGCALLLSLRRKPWAVWLERPWPEDYRPGWTRSVAARNRAGRAARRAILRMFLRLTRRVFCIGTAALEAYEKLGAPQSKLGLLPYCCDTTRFDNVDPQAIEQVRRDLDLNRKVTFLFSGQLIERKGMDVLLNAFNRLAAERNDVALVVLGDGGQRTALEDSVSAAIRERVRFTGHIAYDTVPAYFKAADVFVFPSRHDGWGVVVNEACAASLPVITTSAVGAARDLVVDGYNGFVLERDDTDGFYEKMKHLAENPAQARVMGERSHELVQKFSLPAGVELFYQNCLAAMESA